MCAPGPPAQAELDGHRATNVTKEAAILLSMEFPFVSVRYFAASRPPPPLAATALANFCTSRTPRPAAGS